MGQHWGVWVWFCVGMTVCGLVLGCLGVVLCWSDSVWFSIVLFVCGSVLGRQGVAWYWCVVCVYNIYISAANCQYIEIVLHLTASSYIYI